MLGVRQVVPMHWGTFPLLTGTPAELEDARRAEGHSGAGAEAGRDGGIDTTPDQLTDVRRTGLVETSVY